MLLKAGALAAQLRQPYRLTLPDQAAPLEVVISVSIGVALYPDHARKFDDLVRLADDAMYKAKLAGKGQCVLATAAAGA